VSKVNMELWDSVSVTDPSMTKKVNQRGGFTSIDAHSQVMAATEAFGPIGEGWGYDNVFTYEGGMVICLLTFWWRGNGDEVGNSFGPVPGCSNLLDNRGKPDTDAHKKALTDGLTKALSHLGFNADVFLGYFDDNKYVEDARLKIGQKKQGEYRLQEMLQTDADYLNAYKRMVQDGDALMLFAFENKIASDDPLREALWDCWDHGQKTKMNAKVGELRAEAHKIITDMAVAVSEHIANDDEAGLVETWDDAARIKGAIVRHLSPEDQEYLKNRAVSKAEDKACRSAV